MVELARPYTLLSCSVSLDGYLGGPGSRRLLLSNDADFDRVDEVRASCDAILVGAATVRKDDPRLVIRKQHRRQARLADGLPESPAKVTITTHGDLDPRGNFFTAGNGERLVYCSEEGLSAARKRLGDVATVVDAGVAAHRLRRVACDLRERGVRRLMVEGGGNVHTQFLTEGLADELHLVVAPFFVGDSRARRFVDDGRFPWCINRRARLIETRAVGDVALIRYALSDRFAED